MRRRWVAVVLLVLTVGEVIPIVRWEHAPVDVPRVYRWLNEVRTGPVLELPTIDEWSVHFLYLLYATTHRVPLMNGTSGFEPPVHLQLRDAYENRRMGDDFTQLLERHGCKILILHGDRLAYNVAHTAQWADRAMAAGRIALLRRFDNGLNGDYVFAITRNMPDWMTYRDFDRDAAGFSAEEKWRRFKSGEATYNASTFGRLDTPRTYERHTRLLRISGWALSPWGIRSATARIQSGKLVVPMTLYERPDVVARYPWYPKTPRPGIAATVPKRPKGMARETDLQIEIVDGAGRVTRLPDVPFRWD